MARGIRATVKFDAPEGCPVARRSATAGTTIDRTTTSVAAGESGSVTEYLVDAGDATAAAAAATDEEGPDGDSEPIFSYGSATVHRVRHDESATCPCECLGEFGCPVHRYVADEGDLTLVFHAESFEQLQTVMAAFRERFDGVDVQRLLQPPLDGTPEERVLVNRGRLTGRQLEVLQAAYRMGYFERPKRANATEVAAELGISQSTFSEHLGTAQQKLLEDVLEGTV